MKMRVKHVLFVYKHLPCNLFSDCNTENMTSSGAVTSPLYPAQYPLNSVCKWSPKPLNKTSSLYITFNNLDLAKGHTVSILNKLDPVMVYNGMKGSNLPPDFIMKVEKNSTASISFNSSIIDLGKGVEAVGQGFSLLYRTLGKYLSCACVIVMVFNAMFNNISVISWQSDLLVEEIRVL
jgi:hypothetical protein